MEFIKFTSPLLSKFKPLSVAIPLASGVNVLDNCDSFVPSTASNFCIPFAIRVKSDSFRPWKLCIAPLRIFTPLASFCRPFVSTLPKDLVAKDGSIDLVIRTGDIIDLDGSGETEETKINLR